MVCRSASGRHAPHPKVGWGGVILYRSTVSLPFHLLIHMKKDRFLYGAADFAGRLASAEFEAILGTRLSPKKEMGTAGQIEFPALLWYN